jgi:hypothetical protein
VASFPDLEDHLLTLPNVEKRRTLLVFNDLVYKPTGEKIVTGFRYFACDIGPLVDAFSRADLAAIGKLPFALDEDGDSDTSGVLLDLAYTESGALVAAQPVEYRDHNPTPVAASMVLEGEQAKALIAIVKDLDQSS